MSNPFKTDYTTVTHSPDFSVSTIYSAELSSINSQLINHGWTKKPLDLSALGAKDHNDVVSVLFELLGASVANVNNLDAMVTRHKTLQYEHERLLKAHNNLKTTNLRLTQETNGWRMRCEETVKTLTVEQNKTKELREEIGRGRKALEGVRTAATHENKKIQMKLDKALTTLTRQSEAPQQKSTGLVLLNPIPAGRLQPIASTSSPLLEQTLKDLTDTRESLQEETEAFRHVVVSTGNALREALAASQGKEAPPRLMQSQFFTLNTSSLRRSHLIQSASSTSHPTMANTRLQSIIAEIRAKLVENAPPPVPSNGIYGPTPEEIEETKRSEREQEKLKRDLEDTIKDLQVELVCARKKEEEASKVVEEMARKELEAATAKGDMEGVLARQKDMMEIERRAMRENRERLETERKQLETERQAWLEEKRQADLDAMLAFIPSASPDDPVLPDQAEVEIEDVNEMLDDFVLPSSPAGPSTYHKHMHMPYSSSPLSSPAAPRMRSTPKHHAVKNRRKSIKTPLSRLVLEKAVRSKSQDGLPGPAKDIGNVLGNERGRKTNLAGFTSANIGHVSSPSRKGKEKVGPGLGVGGGLGIGHPSHGLKSSVNGIGKARSSSGSSTTSKSTSTSTSTSTAKATPLSVRTMAPSTGLRNSVNGVNSSVARKVDMNKVGGIGPMAARKAKGAWR
ncbi:uncharacterized protein I303_103454 [Kwoniella dejecticola CBS 10117]|uniref:Afadin and alpha-actinin-binding-domain-containing protein n=1 Tax=Kwoniella dejecticola CBS 10117 TaxID=1296121 RepID=A0A1A6A6T0_9TREE|nr:uncharacterized protein I303_03477 [Kwoniella dejecticola CBS 10117]OBR85765.1 hypothetical protein I303_03477 [Kwoniella dejecticola CBS 10117]